VLTLRNTSTEVYPHIPDAIYVYEYDQTKKLLYQQREVGAQFPFTRYFEEYHPLKQRQLAQMFLQIEV
jgi:type I restriction enzyme M protein